MVWRAVMLVVLLALTGCGGGGDAPEDNGPKPPAPICEATPRPPSCL